MLLLHDMLDVVEAYNRGLEYLDYNERPGHRRLQRGHPPQSEACGGLFSRGFALAELGDLERALADYARVIELQADYAAAYLNRAGVYERVGRTPRRPPIANTIARS